MAELRLLPLTPQQVHTLDELKARMQLPRAPVQDPLDQSDQEYEAENWLEQRSVPDAWRLVPVFVSNDWDVHALEGVEQTFPGEQLAPVLKWLAAGLSVRALLDDVNLGAERVSEIVKAVKAYSYLDQAPVQQVDVHEGLENTLVILRHKLAGVRIERQYAQDLPRIEAYGSELNQVWTNILDNAAYAMEGKGVIKLKTYADGEYIVVELEDSGPGIPAEIQQRIFEPFFTTKPPGLGTGLGLHIAYSIVNNHNGRIRVTSRPGSTCFQITLPMQLSH
jgi:signal transduction histidine kinase